MNANRRVDVAVKVLRVEYLTDADFIRQFNREAQAASQMSHPNIVNMYDVGQDGDTRYLVMEYVKGITLKDMIRQKGQIKPQRAVQMTRGDYDRYDLLLGMESRHLSAMRRICGGDPQNKICRLLDYSANPRDIADPWYTDDFDTACADITEGCEALLRALLAEREA